jgi:flagellar protein FlaI
MSRLVNVDISSGLLTKFLSPHEKTVKKTEQPEQPPKEPSRKKMGLLERLRSGSEGECKPGSTTVECYDPKIHGPLVDQTMQPLPNVEVVEVYPVNEPFAYVRILYNHETLEYTYEVLEPQLRPEEKALLGELKNGIIEALDVNVTNISRADATKALAKYMDVVLREYHITITVPTHAKLFYYIERDFIGDSLIDALMHDPNIEDISCDGCNEPIFIFHRKYETIESNIAFTDTVELNSFVTKLAQRAGKFISISDPLLDASMPDGSRIQMTLGSEVTAHGSTFTIRKFKDEPVTPTDLIQWSTFSPLSIAFLWLAVENGKSCIFTGGTASGKTTSLNAIALFIPRMAKIITLEDTRELKLPHPNWIPSVTRDAFSQDGKGSVDMYELLKAALRQRPEYLIVGEVRGQEALTLFQAMSTGHITYSTMHADSVASAVHRLENQPINVPRNMLTSLHLMSIQVQVQVGGKRTRRNRQIIEILDIDSRTNELITNEVFRWHEATDEIKFSGKSYVLESIMDKKGWTQERMTEELKNRQLVLEWMRQKKMQNYKDVSNVLISYSRRPEQLLERIKHDLDAAQKPPAVAAVPAAQ